MKAFIAPRMQLSEKLDFPCTTIRYLSSIHNISNAPLHAEVFAQGLNKCIKGSPITKVLSSSTNLAKVWHSDNPIEEKYNFSVLSLLSISSRKVTQSTSLHTAVLTIKLYIHSYTVNVQFAVFSQPGVVSCTCAHGANKLKFNGLTESIV